MKISVEKKRIRSVFSTFALKRDIIKEEGLKSRL